ncbi:MAG: hypothetical protein PHT02_14815 [Tissierellia bacterium]|nr:hypothetical protein [Tissierellia bacterium]
MRYSFNKFNSDELNDFLSLFNINILSYPISKNQKHFRNYIRGFRPNKLPIKILSKIYYDEINQEINSPLQRYLTDITKDYFKNTKIEELIGSLDEKDQYETLIEIFKEIISLGLFVKTSHIFTLAEVDVDKNVLKAFDEILKFTIDTKNEIKKDCESNINKTYEEKYNKLNEQLIKTSNELSKERSKLKDLEKIKTQKELIISSRENENNLLIQKLNKLNREVETYEEKVIDLEKKVQCIEKKESEIKELKKINTQLEEKNYLLEENSLSPETTRILSTEILEDLRNEEIKEDKFISDARKIFSKEETLDVSWEGLSRKEGIKLRIIIETMKNNKCNHNDIEILDEIEDYIQYKYIMIKALKVLFYKYLEQESTKKTIDQNFI